MNNRNEVLNVLLMESPKGRWFAQSLEIDYFSEGESLEDVLTSFVNDLISHVGFNLREGRSMSDLLSPAPSRYFSAYYLHSDNVGFRDILAPDKAPFDFTKDVPPFCMLRYRVSNRPDFDTIYSKEFDMPKPGKMA